MEIFFQLILSVLLGALIGVEREYKKKEAGLRTYSLVSLGTCLFTVMSFDLYKIFSGAPGINFDPSRIIQAVAAGIGFIGAGVIFRQTSGVVGLTTAAGLWVSSAVGVAVGSGFYIMAVAGTVLALFILVFLGWLEEKIFKKGSDRNI